MGYLFCEKCGGYYELKEGESADDFKSFKCECGGKLKYVESLDEVKSSDVKLNLKCPFCGFENNVKNKLCGKCGKSLEKGTGLDIDDTQKPLFNYNKLIRPVLAVLIIVAFLFFLTWFIGNVTANHYDNGIISFDYPTDFTATNGTTAAAINSSQQYHGFVYDRIAGVTYTINSDKESQFHINIYIVSKNATIEIPINKTVDRVMGIDSEGNYELTQVSVHSGETKKESIQTLLDNPATVGEPNKYSKNGYNYYEWKPVFDEDAWGNSTYYQTIIEKENYPYFFFIELKVVYLYGEKGDDTKGYNAYKKILDTFKIG